MAKKIIEEEVAEETTEEVVAPRLTNDFGRDDLNEMRDAINELYQR
jgi:hypothetical protein